MERSKLVTPLLDAVLEESLVSAHNFSHEYIGSEHLLHALAKQDHGVALEVLAGYGISPERIRNRIEQTVGPRKSNGGRHSLPYTTRAKRVLEFALQSARVGRRVEAGTGDLLVGLVREQSGIAAQVLHDLGFVPNHIDELSAEVNSKDIRTEL